MPQQPDLCKEQSSVTNFGLVELHAKNIPAKFTKFGRMEKEEILDKQFLL